MLRKLIICLCALTAFVSLLASCDSNSEQKRAVITVFSMNDNEPFFSDVLAQGDSVYDISGAPIQRDDFVKEDYINITFYNKPYNDYNTADPGDPLGEFLITRYRIDWERVDGSGTEVPPPFNGATSLILPIGAVTEGAVLLVPFEEKNKTYLQELSYVGPRVGQEVMCIAHYTFWGHEVGTGGNRETSFKASISVNFGDIVIKSKIEQ